MQAFTPGVPALNSLAVSQPVRDNFAALLSNHSGAALPAYAVEGTTFFDTDTKSLCVAKARGSKPFTFVPMGPQITLFVSGRDAGVDGATVASDVRVQDSTLLATDYDWSSSPQKLYFSSLKTPSWFAYHGASTMDIDKPILLAFDGILLGKTWEAIPVGDHEIIYSSSTFQNFPNWQSTTLRAVELESDHNFFEFELEPLSGRDHFVVIPPRWDWDDVRLDGGWVMLLENGVERDPATFSIRPFVESGVVRFVIYNFDPQNGDLKPFTTSRHTLKIRKSSL